MEESDQYICPAATVHIFVVDMHRADTMVATTMNKHIVTLCGYNNTQGQLVRHSSILYRRK